MKNAANCIDRINCPVHMHAKGIFSFWSESEMLLNYMDRSMVAEKPFWFSRRCKFIF